MADRYLSARAVMAFGMLGRIHLQDVPFGRLHLHMGRMNERIDRMRDRVRRIENRLDLVDDLKPAAEWARQTGDTKHG